MSKYWGKRQKDRFARLQYPQCSETFFWKVITIVEMIHMSQAQAMAIWKLNNIVYSRLNNPSFSVISDWWKHDIT